MTEIVHNINARLIYLNIFFLCLEQIFIFSVNFILSSLFIYPRLFEIRYIHSTKHKNLVHLHSQDKEKVRKILIHEENFRYIILFSNKSFIDLILYRFV